MVAQLRELLADLSFGEPIDHERLRIVPLRLERKSTLDYLTLDEANGKELIEVNEVSSSGAVRELNVRNRSNRPVLIIDGTTLVGLKQNRVVNLSIMLGPETDTVIPVSCLERGRWSPRSRYSSPSEHCDSSLRAMMCAGATESLKRHGNASVDQGAVWDHVDAALAGSGARSPTAAYHAAYEEWGKRITEYEATLHCPEAACGVAVQIDGAVETIDLFDKPATLHKVWPRLRRGYIVSSLWRREHTGRQSDIQRVLADVLSSKSEAFDAVGVGTTVRLANDQLVGGALVSEEQMVHLSLFANGDPARSWKPRQSATQQVTSVGPKTSRSTRPWWKFWRGDA